MKAVLTRVSSASVSVDNEIISAIDCPETGGLLALVGISRDDEEDSGERVNKMARKIAELRILSGDKNVEDVSAPVLLVSQFTLYGRTAKGRRPSWSDAAPSEVAEPIISELTDTLRKRGITVQEGKFGAEMKVASINEGPFTVLVET